VELMIKVFGELLSSINHQQAGKATEGLVQQSVCCYAG
jgi:hypothetical protein